MELFYHLVASIKKIKISNCILICFCAHLFSCNSIIHQGNIDGVYYISRGDNLNEKFNSIFSNRKKNVLIYLEKGDYYIDRQLYFNNLEEVSIIGNDSKVFMRSNSPVENGFGMISFKECNHLLIENLTFDANRNSRICREVAAHTFMIVSSRDITISGVNCINNAVDGFIIYTETPQNFETYCSDITLNNCKSINSYRNAISVINGYNILGTNCSFLNSNGTLPESGLVIESDIDSSSVCSKNIEFVDCDFRNNNGWGIIISQKCNPSEVKITDCRIFSSRVGGIWNCSVNTTIKSNHFNNNGEVAVRSVRYESRNLDTILMLGNNFVNEKTGIDYLGAGARIESNKFDSITLTGVLLNGITIDNTFASLQSNVFENCFNSAIILNRFKNSLIVDNKILGKTKNGIEIRNSKTRIISNEFNIVENALNINHSDVELVGNIYKSCLNKYVTGEDVLILNKDDN